MQGTKETLSPLSNEAKSLKRGVYEHYRGHRYMIIGVGRDEETLGEIVIYQELYGEGNLWVRPLKTFLEYITKDDGKVVPRFRYVSS